jgi:hypothetical protein
MVVSSYLQRVKSNKVRGSVELDDYARGKFAEVPLNPRWNWYAKARMLERAFGDVTVEWYPAVAKHGSTGVVQATFAWLGFESSVAPEDAPIVNPTPGQEALAVLRRANAQGAGGKWFADALLLEAYRRNLLGQKVTLSPPVAEEIEAKTLESNTALLARYCPQVSPCEMVVRRPCANGAADEEMISRLEEIAERITRESMIHTRNACSAGFGDDAKHPGKSRIYAPADGRGKALNEALR